jgi:hypothetical protein
MGVLPAFYLYDENIDIWVLAGATLIFASNFIAMRKEASGYKETE